MRTLAALFQHVFKSKFFDHIPIVMLVIIFASLLSVYCLLTHENHYPKTIAKVVTLTEADQVQAVNGVDEQVTKQQITAFVINGVHQGEQVQLENFAPHSHALGLNLKVDDEIFIRIHEAANHKIVACELLDLKRDRYIAYICILFILLLLVVARRKGFRSLVSVITNIALIAVVIQLYVWGNNLILISSLASIFFIIMSLTIVSGINEKTLSAIAGTLASIIISMLITIAVIFITKGEGIHYEEMEFLTSPPDQIFMAEILIGTLGAIMDIAISISSALHEIYSGNPEINRKFLVRSGMEIGKDIMGTMANTLILAYISGSIPMILLWLKNGYSVIYIFNVNLSLEIIRALVGSIGIVVSIPITVYASVLLLYTYRIGEVKKL